MSRRFAGAGLLRRFAPLYGGVGLAGGPTVLRTVGDLEALTTVGGIELIRVVDDVVDEDGTPLGLYSTLTEEAIAAKFSGFVQPEAPTVAGDVIATTWAGAVAAATANPGRQLRISASPTPGTGIEFVNCENVELLLADGVDASNAIIEVGTGADHFRVRGEGANVRLGSARIAGTATHIVFDSLLLPGSALGEAVAIQGSPGPCAFIRCVAGSTNYSGAYAALISTTSDVLLAKCNFLNDLGGGAPNNWTVRFGSTTRVVVVDCYSESVTSQPPFRHNGGDKIAFFDTTTIHRSDGESICVVGSGSAEEHTAAYADGCVHYVGGDTASNRYGGLNAGGVVWHTWHATDTTWHAEAGNPVSDSNLATAESGEPTAGDWEYRLGTPSYNVWNGSHPGWQTITGWHGTPLATSDPALI